MKARPLITLLRERGMRMADLARLVNVDKATVTRWSKKEIPSDRLVEISSATGIPASELRPDLASVFTPEPAQP